jgi:hypothetical protein
MKIMADFHLYDFISKIERNHVITLIKDQSTTDVHVNLELLSHYTNFFKEKKGLINDNVYSISFCVGIAVEMFEHIHTLFTSLQYTNENLFKLLNAFDYFCIDVESVYNHIFSKNIYSDKMLQIWAKDALSNPSELSLKFINKLYDKHFDIYNNFYVTECMDILLFMLKRKWKVKHMDREQFLKRSSILEACLFDSIIHYINRPSKTIQNENGNENGNENKYNKKIELNEFEQRERDTEFFRIVAICLSLLALKRNTFIIFKYTICTTCGRSIASTYLSKIVYFFKCSCDK